MIDPFSKLFLTVILYVFNKIFLSALQELADSIIFLKCLNDLLHTLFRLEIRTFQVILSPNNIPKILIQVICLNSEFPNCNFIVGARCLGKITYLVLALKNQKQFFCCPIM